MRNFFGYIVLLFLLSSCFNRNILFKTSSQYEGDSLAFKVQQAESYYLLQPNDYLELNVYTNKGELLIDPNFELRKTIGVGGAGMTTSGGIAKPTYLIYPDGKVIMPMIGEIQVVGLRLREVDSLFQKLYSQFYKEVFVKTKVTNKRVIIFGNNSIGLGAITGTVIPLLNENMSLIEVIALAGGLDQLSKSYNIRLIRGDLKNPSVQTINLSTMDGVRKANLIVQPNDIIYIERFHKRIIQSIQDIAPIFSVFSLVITLLVLFKR